MQDLPLGKETNYKFNYDNNLLVAIPRKLGPDAIGIAGSNNAFQGVDIWNCYEMSWLNPNGLPVVRIMRLYVESSSPSIVESKSLKLYLNSFSGDKFESGAQVKEIITRDLTNLLESDIMVEIHELSDFDNHKIMNFQSISIDNQPELEIRDYHVNKDLLKCQSDEVVEEELTSNLLKSNCLVTNQPDWASLYIKYKGKKIDHSALLQYIISFRDHSEFHEQCVEHIFTDLMEKCQPEQLTVYAKYTRRGGIDINPYRTNQPYDIGSIDQIRTTRQ